MVDDGVELKLPGRLEFCARMSAEHHRIKRSLIIGLNIPDQRSLIIGLPVREPLSAGQARPSILANLLPRV
jgi:hypothetical protein